MVTNSLPLFLIQFFDSYSSLKSKLLFMTSTELIKLLKKNGWYEDSQKGSHKHFKHATNKNKVTVADHKGKDIPKGTLNDILKQAGLK